MTTFEIDTLVCVVQRAVGVLLGLEAELVAHRETRSREAYFDVSAIIGVTGCPKGTLVVSFPIDFAREVTRSMLGEASLDAISDQDVSDCVGEIANIVAGNVLPALRGGESGGKRISLPSVVVGSHRVVHGRRESPCELLLFETSLGGFAVESNLRQLVPEP